MIVQIYFNLVELQKGYPHLKEWISVKRKKRAGGSLFCIYNPFILKR